MKAQVSYMYSDRVPQASLGNGIQVYENQGAAKVTFVSPLL